MGRRRGKKGVQTWQAISLNLLWVDGGAVRWVKKRARIPGTQGVPVGRVHERGRLRTEGQPSGHQSGEWGPPETQLTSQSRRR